MLVLQVICSVLLVFATIWSVGFVLNRLGVEFAPVKARRICVTLKQNEGAFVGLLVEKHWKRWTFEDVSTPPSRPSEMPGRFDGRMHVPTSNILYYQEIPHAPE